MCSEGVCQEDFTHLCEGCTLIMAVLDKRLPKIFRVYSFFLTLYLCNFGLYTAQRAMNLSHSSDG